VRVALDVTHATLNRTGVGRYPAELRPALEARQDLELIPIAEPVSPPGRRLARAVWREGTYYPHRLARRARASGAHVLHCPAVAPVRARNLALVVTVHDLLPLRMPELFTAQVRAHVKVSARFIRRAARVLTNSEWTRGEVVELLGVPEERVVATPFGVAPRFAPGPVDREALHVRFGITGRYVLSVGTREPRKNLLGVLRAFRRLSAAAPDAQLVLAGGRGWLGEEIEAELARAGERVRTCGFVSDEDLVALYRGAAVFAFPSLVEGFGFPPLEAMACGVPVVASDRGGLVEVAGGAALVVDPHDPDALADALRRVLEQPELAADLRRRGLERSAAHTWERCAEATVGAYRDALASTAS
jgi:glycosyltransferase involved in cell wall biosynthesis